MWSELVPVTVNKLKEMPSYSTIYSAIVGKFKTAVSFPSGVDGALSINGTTTTLAAGSLKDYSSISIINGGKLNITGTTGLWTKLGCAGNFTIDGTSSIVCQTNGNPDAATITDITPDGHALSYSYVTNNGGLGGASIFGGDGPPDPGFGNGTGGQAAGTPGDPDENGSGSGGDGSNHAGPIPGGAGVAIYGVIGNDGSSGGGGISVIGEVVGGGGGGGTRGKHGGGLSITVAGTVSLAAGAIISVVGQAGGGGGAGVVTNDFGGSCENDAGGGGGGGAGGSGGKIDFRWKSIGTTPTTTFCKVNGGAGGAGGLSDQSTGFGGTSGIDGDAGNTGSFILSTF